MRFKSWHYLKQMRENGEIDIYTKAGLKEIDMKPKKGELPQVYEVYTGGHYRKFDFYTLEQSEQIKKRNTIVKELEITQENVCKSLYVINKSAKISRDTI